MKSTFFVAESSKGFKGARTNPLQESAISNFHRVWREMLFDESTGA